MDKIRACNANEDYHNFTISELISSLRSTFHEKDFDKVEQIFSLREEKTRQEKEEDEQKISELKGLLEKKDKEIEAWRMKYKGLEIRVENLEEDTKDLITMAELSGMNKGVTEGLRAVLRSDGKMRSGEREVEVEKGLSGKAMGRNGHLLNKGNGNCNGVSEQDRGPPLVTSFFKPSVNAEEEKENFSKLGVARPIHDDVIEICDSDEETPVDTSKIRGNNMDHMLVDYNSWVASESRKERVSQVCLTRIDSDQSDEELLKLTSKRKRRRDSKTVVSESEEEGDSDEQIPVHSSKIRGNDMDRTAVDYPSRVATESRKERTSQVCLARKVSDQSNEENGELLNFSLSSARNRKQISKMIVSESEDDDDDYSVPIRKCMNKPKEPIVGVDNHKVSSPSEKVGNGMDKNYNASDPGPKEDGISRLLRHLRENLRGLT